MSKPAWSTDPTASMRLLEAAEIAKIELTNNTTTRISLPFITVAAGAPKNLDMELTRTELERLVEPVLGRCRGPVEQALRDAAIAPSQIDRIVFVGGPTRMPVVRALFENIFGRKAEMGVDPMECVAAGAAIQAGVLTGEVGNIVLVDVTPLTLSVETLGGVATALLSRNTPIPIKKTETFTTAADLQTTVTIHVIQGERPMAADNASLGQFNLDGLPPAPRGIPKIEVTFDIDSSGILDVSAKDTATGKSRSIRITGSTRLPEDVKKKMMDEAQRFAEQDKKRRQEADQLNAADATCYQAEKMLADFGGKLSADLRKRVEAALKETREPISRKDAALAAQRAEALQKVLAEAGATLYAQAGPAPGQGPGGIQSPPPGGPKVVEAEYRETR